MEEAKKTNRWHYTNELKPLATGLRNNMTKAEACIWKFVLRAGMMKGYTFRRQRPVLNYIADFLCKDLMLIIEIDGVTHHDELAVAKDSIRQQTLEAAGFTVLRFSDNEVLQHIDAVHNEIADWIDSKTSV